MATVLVSFIIVFLCALARVYGPAATQSGMLASVVAVVAVGCPKPLSEALGLAGVFLMGCVWALALCLFVWRIHPNAPARRAVGAIFQQLSDMATELLASSHSGSVPDVSWQAQSAEHRRAVRGTIKRARAMVGRSLAGCGGGPVRRGLEAAIEAGDRSFAGLIALSHDVAAGKGAREEDADSQMLRHITAVLAEAGRQVRHSEPDWTLVAAETAALARLAEANQSLAGRMAGACARVLSELANAWATPMEAEVPISGDQKAEIVSLRRALRFASPICRHALRLSVTVVVAYVITATLHMPYAYWATMVPIVVMQPRVATTWPRAVERVIGSVVALAGCLVLWPDREPEGLRHQLAHAVEQNMHYAALVIRGVDVSFDVTDSARRAAGVASTAAEITRQRMILEGRRRLDHLDEAGGLLLALRKLAGAATVAWLDETFEHGHADLERADDYDRSGQWLGR